MAWKTFTSRSWPLQLVAAAVLLTCLAPDTAALNVDRMDKDIRIMENVINTAMIESELVYVYSFGKNVRGLYIPGFGALFTLEAELVAGRGVSWMYLYDIENGPFVRIFSGKSDEIRKFFDRITKDGKGDKISIRKFSLKWDEDEDEGDDGRTSERLKENRELIEKNIEEFEEELAGILADYGGTIRELKDDEWVMIVAYLRGTSKFVPVSRISVRATKRDLDKYDRGDIDFDELMSRMTIEER